MKLTYYQIRKAEPEDHSLILDVLPGWWAKRDLSHMIPKVFLLHFHTTSLIAEYNGNMIAFLIGFDSQAYLNEAYIHFVGVHPNHRKQGIGRSLYELFFERCQRANRKVVRACTSPVNGDSIAFHTKIGFMLEDGGGLLDGLPVFLDYNKPGDHKVRFKIKLFN